MNFGDDFSLRHGVYLVITEIRAARL